MDALKQVEDAIKIALERALPDQQSMDWGARLTGDIGLDSVQIMNLVMEIEDELDMSVPIETLAEVQTLNQLSERLCQLKKPNS